VKKYSEICTAFRSGPAFMRAALGLPIETAGGARFMRSPIVTTYTRGGFLLRRPIGKTLSDYLRLYPRRSLAMLRCETSRRVFPVVQKGGMGGRGT